MKVEQKCFFFLQICICENRVHFKHVSWS